MSKIDVFTVEKFIDRLEKFVKPNLPTNELISYVTAIIKDARELISFGEKRLALDILLENLIEEKIIIDKETLSTSFPVYQRPSIIIKAQAECSCLLYQGFVEILPNKLFIY